MGKIVGLFGVRGWVKVYSHSRPKEAILSYRPWLLRRKNEWLEAEVAEGHLQGRGLVVRLKGCTGRDQAAELVGAEVALKPSQLPKPRKGEFYWAQLEGLRVVNLKDEELGTVSHLFETGANDVLVVKQGRRERLIPFTKHAVHDVDLDSGAIRVDWDKDF